MALNLSISYIYHQIQIKGSPVKYMLGCFVGCQIFMWNKNTHNPDSIETAHVQNPPLRNTNFFCNKKRLYMQYIMLGIKKTAWLILCIRVKKDACLRIWRMNALPLGISSLANIFKQFSDETDAALGFDPLFASTLVSFFASSHQLNRTFLRLVIRRIKYKFYIGEFLFVAYFNDIRPLF